jgi:hypothetical protein
MRGLKFLPSDEDLSLHPSEQKSLAGDPESPGTPVNSCLPPKHFFGIQRSGLVFHSPVNIKVNTIKGKKRKPFPAGGSLLYSVASADSAWKGISLSVAKRGWNNGESRDRGRETVRVGGSDGD